MATRRALALLPFLFAFACAPDYAGMPPVDGTDPVPTGRAHLEVVGASSIQVEAGGAVEIELRYLDANDAIVPEALIDLSVEGDAAVGSLAAMTAQTDGEGVAVATLRTEAEGTVDVVASANEADPARATVTVRPMVFGTLGVTVSYMGSRPLTGAELGLFVNASCEDLARAVPSPATVRSVGIGSRTELDGLALDVPMALYALGIDGADRVAAETCTDVTMTEPNREVNVPLSDVAVRVRGPYATVETFDVTDGFPSGLDTVLDIAGGLGSADPAAWLVDLVANHPSTPSWLRTALGSTFTRSLVASLLGDVLEEIHLPTEIADTIRFGADVNAAFAGLTLDGVLTFSDPDEYGVAMGVHAIQRVRLPLSDGTEAQHNYETPPSADTVVTFGDRIDLDEHALPIAFGDLVETILRETLLSRLPGAPATMGELVGSYFDCEAIAARLGTGTTASLAEAACTVGVTMLEGRVDGAIRSLWDYDTLNLSGSADLVDSDQDYDLDQIADGEAHARWTNESDQLEFDGTFTGSSMNDPELVHPIRERMTGLE
ncbi:MAG: Ig-like domain-containing protein [Sandaracinaceae bacterium]|nr:Ig-like domain-containing protein [Sandaracinaceae bacterium]